MTNRFNFRGSNAEAPYFEGWYVKSSDPEQDFSIALIPGIALFGEEECFVQYNIYYKGKMFSGKITFPADEFEIVDDPYSVLMPLFVLSENGVMAHLKDEENDLLIDLKFGELLPLEQNMYTPSIMGPLEYIKVPCYHDIVSMRHDVTGTVIINGESVTLTGGTGYLEKDRGSTFPDKYLWVQSNTFKENEKSALSLAVADIDFGIMNLTGTIAVFHDGVKEHRLSTYFGARTKVVLNNDDSGYTIKISDFNKSLTAEVTLLNSRDLIAPMNNKMDYTIKESVKADIVLVFQERNKKPVRLTTESGAAENVNWK